MSVWSPPILAAAGAGDTDGILPIPLPRKEAYPKFFLQNDGSFSPLAASGRKWRHAASVAVGKTYRLSYGDGAVGFTHPTEAGAGGRCAEAHPTAGGAGEFCTYDDARPMLGGGG